MERKLFETLYSIDEAIEYLKDLQDKGYDHIAIYGNHVNEIAIIKPVMSPEKLMSDEKV